MTDLTQLNPEQRGYAVGALLTAMKIIRDHSVVVLTDRQVMERLVEAFKRIA